MRLSCNGCRVLRKGCTDACTIRPCLQWIKSPDAQANATVFLAKFYGRAGLLNLIAAAPTHALRPAVFRSLLYEACGRVVNPVHGAVGLLCSGTWHMCQAAVEAVLKGQPIVVVQPDAAAAYDIRHVFPCSPARDKDDTGRSSSRLLHKQVKMVKFKRTSSSASPTNKQQPQNPALAAASPATEQHPADHSSDQQEEHHAAARQASNGRRAASSDRHSASASLDTEEAASHVSQAVVTEAQDDQQAEAPLGLDLALRLLTSSAPPPMAPPTPAACTQGGGPSAAAATDEPAGALIGFRFL